VSVHFATAIVVFVDLVEWVKILQLAAVNVVVNDHWLPAEAGRNDLRQLWLLLGSRVEDDSAGRAVEQTERSMGDCRLRNAEPLD
jgi:hypothetical protein